MACSMKQLPTTIASVECHGSHPAPSSTKASSFQFSFPILIRIRSPPPHSKNKEESKIKVFLVFCTKSQMDQVDHQVSVFYPFPDEPELPSESSAPANRTKFELPDVEDHSVAGLDVASGGPEASKRAPLDTLARLFPQTKRTTLKSTLDRCDGDVLRAIEQLVYHNNNPQPESSSTVNPEGPPTSHQHKRKSTDHPHSGREKPTPRYNHHHHHPQAEASLQWKNCLSAVGNAFPNAGSMTGSSSRPPLFPLQSGYFPAAFGYGASSFLAGSFLRPDYPVFPGMNLLTGAGGSNQPGSLEPISPAAYAAYHSAPNVVLHHSSPGNNGGVKQESDLGAMMSENQSSSPRSDRSERSPYSD